MVAAPHGSHPPWFWNLYKRAFRNFQALEALGPSVPADLSGERFSPLKNLGGVPQLQVSWKIWQKMGQDDSSNKYVSSGNIALSGKQAYAINLPSNKSAPT